MVVAAPFPASFLSALDFLSDLKARFQFPGSEAYLLNNTCWNYDCMVRSRAGETDEAD